MSGESVFLSLEFLFGLALGLKDTAITSSFFFFRKPEDPVMEFC